MLLRQDLHTAGHGHLQFAHYWVPMSWFLKHKIWVLSYFPESLNKTLGSGKVWAEKIM